MLSKLTRGFYVPLVFLFSKTRARELLFEDFFFFLVFCSRVTFSVWVQLSLGEAASTKLGSWIAAVVLFWVGNGRKGRAEGIRGIQRTCRLDHFLLQKRLVLLLSTYDVIHMYYACVYFSGGFWHLDGAQN